MTSAVNGVRVVGNWAPAASWDFVNGLVLGLSWTDPSRFVGDFPIPIGTHEYLYGLDVGGVVANEDLKEEAQSGVCPTEDFIWSQPDAFDPYANRTLDALPDQMGSTQLVSDIAEQCTSECVVRMSVEMMPAPGRRSGHLP